MRKRDGKRRRHQLSQKLTPRLPVGAAPATEMHVVQTVHQRFCTAHQQMHTHRYKLRQTHTNIYNHTLTQTLKQQHIHTYLKTILLSFTKYITLTAGSCEHLCCRQERMKSVFEVNQRMCYGWIKCFTNLTIPIPIIVIIKLKFGQDFKVNFRSKH